MYVVDFGVFSMNSRNDQNPQDGRISHSITIYWFSKFHLYRSLKHILIDYFWWKIDLELFEIFSSIFPEFQALSARNKRNHVGYSKNNLKIDINRVQLKHYKSLKTDPKKTEYAILFCNNINIVRMCMQRHNKNGCNHRNVNKHVDAKCYKIFACQGQNMTEIHSELVMSKKQVWIWCSTSSEANQSPKTSWYDDCTIWSSEVSCLKSSAKSRNIGKYHLVGPQSNWLKNTFYHMSISFQRLEERADWNFLELMIIDGSCS